MYLLWFEYGHIKCMQMCYPCQIKNHFLKHSRFNIELSIYNSVLIFYFTNWYNRSQLLLKSSCANIGLFKPFKNYGLCFISLYR